jgi:hypothetical protein
MLVLCYSNPFNIVFILGEKVSACHSSSGGPYDGKVVMMRRDFARSILVNPDLVLIYWRYVVTVVVFGDFYIAQTVTPFLILSIHFEFFCSVEECWCVVIWKIIGNLHHALFIYIVSQFAGADLRRFFACFFSVVK